MTVPLRTPIRVLAVALVVLVFPAAVAGPTIIVTVDVESTTNVPLPQQPATVCVDGHPCGLGRIVEMLRARGLAATFYLDVYEAKSWGEAPLRAIATTLRDAGQDVALHTHPQWAYDPKRVYMYEYSATEQEQILTDGIALLTRWTGLPVVSHRAGSYSANSDTIAALAHHGIRNDSSLFFAQPHSHLNGLGLPNNLPSRIGAVTELPVTVFWRDERPAGWPASAPAFSSVRKLDVNSLIDESEAVAALDAEIKADVPYVLVFLHSFSFIARAEGETSFVADPKAERVFARLLDAAHERGLEFTTMRALAESSVAVPAPGADTVPRITTAVSPLKYLAHHARAAATGHLKAALVAVTALLVLAGTLAVVLRRRVRRAAAPRGTDR